MTEPAPISVGLDAPMLFTEGMLPPPAPRVLTLIERFAVPPFTVLDARAGYWQERKAAWIAMGIRSELGRDAPSYHIGMDGQPIQDHKRHSSSTMSDQMERLKGFQPGEPRIDRGASDGILTRNAERRIADNGTAGVTGAPDTVRDPDFYRKKTEAEGRLGRTLTLEEFRRDHYAEIAKPYASGTSVFDPVLCELVYRWFSPRGGTVLDPFAGGSVRGVVAGVLGRRYIGIDLSAAQVAANEAQIGDMGRWIPSLPTWVTGDSRRVLTDMPVIGADLGFTCPPYYDLEVYSNDPRDLSAMGSYDEFLTAYSEILAAMVYHMRDDAFAAVVVGNLRDSRGVLRYLVGDTVTAMGVAGASLYNEAILTTVVGSAAVRAFQFSIGRKLVRTHQSVLVFVKGDPRRAAERCGIITTSDAAVLDTAGQAETELPAPR